MIPAPPQSVNKTRSRAGCSLSKNGARLLMSKIEEEGFSNRDSSVDSSEYSDDFSSRFSKIGANSVRRGGARTDWKDGFHRTKSLSVDDLLSLTRDSNPRARKPNARSQEDIETTVKNDLAQEEKSVSNKNVFLQEEKGDLNLEILVAPIKEPLNDDELHVLDMIDESMAIDAIPEYSPFTSRPCKSKRAIVKPVKFDILAQLEESDSDDERKEEIDPKDAHEEVSKQLNKELQMMKEQERHSSVAMEVKGEYEHASKVLNDELQNEKRRHRDKVDKLKRSRSPTSPPTPHLNVKTEATSEQEETISAIKTQVSMIGVSKLTLDDNSTELPKENDVKNTIDSEWEGDQELELREIVVAQSIIESQLSLIEDSESTLDDNLVVMPNENDLKNNIDLEPEENQEQELVVAQSIIESQVSLIEDSESTLDTNLMEIPNENDVDNNIDLEPEENQEFEWKMTMEHRVQSPEAEIGWDAQFQFQTGDSLVNGTERESIPPNLEDLSSEPLVVASEAGVAVLLRDQAPESRLHMLLGDLEQISSQSGNQFQEDEDLSRLVVSSDNFSNSSISQMHDNVRKLVRDYVIQGIDWREYFVTRFDLKHIEFNSVPVESFKSALRDCFQIQGSAADTICSQYYSDNACHTIRYIEFFHGIHANTFCNLLNEQIRWHLRRDAAAWGLGYKSLYEDIGQCSFYEKMDVVSVRGLASRYEQPEMSYGNAIYLLKEMKTPCPLCELHVCYSDVVAFIRDPNFASDVFPRLIKKVKLISLLEDVPVGELEEIFAKALIGIQSIDAFTIALVNVGLCQGYEAMSQDELERVSRRFDMGGTRFQVDVFIKTLFAFVRNTAELEMVNELVETHKPIVVQKPEEISILNYEEMIFAEANKRQAAKLLAWERDQNKQNNNSDSQGSESSEESNETAESDFVEEDDDDDSEDSCAFEYPNLKWIKETPTFAPVVFDTSSECSSSSSSDSELNEDGAFPNRVDQVSRRLAPVAGDVLDFAIYLGMDTDTDMDWMWLAEECLYAPLPKGWQQARDITPTGEGDLYFWRADDPHCKTQWEHPLDPFFRKLFERLKEEKFQREEDKKLGGEWSNMQRSNARKSQRPQSAMPLSRNNNNTEASVELQVLRSLAKKSSNFEDTQLIPSSSAKARPGSAAPVRSKGISVGRVSNRIMPLGEIGGHNGDEETPMNSIWKPEKHRKQHNPRIMPVGLASMYTEKPDECTEEATPVEISLLPKHRPFPDEKVRPVWWYLKDEFDVLTPDQLLDLAEFFGVILPDEAHLMWIVKAAALAPVPEGWRLCADEYSRDLFFASTISFEVTRYHPLDPFFALLIQSERELVSCMDRSEETWSIFFRIENAETYYFDFATSSTQVYSPLGDTTLPVIVERDDQISEDEQVSAYKQALWSALHMTESTIPKLVSPTFYNMLGRCEVIKLMSLLDMLIHEKQKEFKRVQDANYIIKSAVESRRVTSEQLTKHLTMSRK